MPNWGYGSGLSSRVPNGGIRLKSAGTCKGFHFGIFTRKGKAKRFRHISVMRANLAVIQLCSFVILRHFELRAHNAQEG